MIKKRQKKLSRECMIVQDADRLDAIGAIGIARNFFSTALFGQPFGTLEDMSEFRGPYNAGRLNSAIQHFYTKLLRLRDSMNTEYAKKLAKERHEFMLEFLRRFKLEWNLKM
jgi:uncharacterized protein